MTGSSTGQSNHATDGVNTVVSEGVIYAQRDAGAMKLDLYVPETDRRPPLVVYVHGGGWVMETRKNTPDLERYAAEWGVAFASVSYRLAPIPEDADPEFQPGPDNPTPKGAFPAQIIDVKAAIRWLRDNAETFGFDAEKVAVWGASAGGHLAALAATLDDVEDLAGEAYPEHAVEKRVAPERSSALQALVAWYPVTDFLELPHQAESVESILLGGPIDDNPERARVASPRAHVTPDNPPALLMHGRADDVVPIRQSRIFADALAEHGVDATLYEIHDEGHVFGAESERSAMDGLTADPRPAQSITATAHGDKGSTTDVLLDAVPPAGPKTIEQFLTRTIR
ncbi:alpha/beta hydrolase [Halorhabdus amylolytica]|uniref:alpha/beta hydrolase n=1 Tax=Halorhabdus amylolytica TaxID=2559573 RepID=UPI0010A9B25F|nr:alpha/beta hydrolase [Halorhabdus amylolytica]